MNTKRSLQSVFFFFSEIFLPGTFLFFFYFSGPKLLMRANTACLLPRLFILSANHGFFIRWLVRIRSARLSAYPMNWISMLVRMLSRNRIAFHSCNSCILKNHLIKEPCGKHTAQEKRERSSYIIPVQRKTISRIFNFT